jgi:hypothetical protein
MMNLLNKRIFVMMVCMGTQAMEDLSRREEAVAAREAQVTGLEPLLDQHMAQMQVRLRFDFLPVGTKEEQSKDSAPLLDQHMAQTQVRHKVWIMVSGLGSPVGINELLVFCYITHIY